MPLRQRIQDFWKYFNNIQKDIQEDLRHGDYECLQQHIHTCNERLLQINGSEIEFEKNDDFFEMTFVNHGDASAQYISALLKKDAPEAILDDWIINSYRPALSEKAYHSVFEVKGTTYQGSDFKIYYEIDEINKLIPIKVFCKGLLELDDDQKFRITKTMLELFIGELELEARISDIEILTEEIETDDMCLLPNFYEDICDIIVDQEWTEYHDPSQIYMAYKIDEKIIYEGLRKDMKMILTTCPHLQEEILNNDFTICKQMLQYGGEYGYLYYELKEESEEYALLRQQLEKELHNLLYPLSFARTIGGAMGTHYAYIDLLIYDKNAFLLALRKIREHLNFDVYYKPFYQEIIG